MAKTVPTDASVDDFLRSSARADDALALCQLFTKATGAQPTMWGASIVGFGTYHYVYGTGRTGEWPAVGFSPRKANLTVYLAEGFEGYADLLAALGPHTTGKACLYMKRLSDIDTSVLAKLVKTGFKSLQRKTAALVTLFLVRHAHPVISAFAPRQSSGRLSADGQNGRRRPVVPGGRLLRRQHRAEGVPNAGPIRLS